MGWIFLKYLHISIFKFRFLEPYFGLCKWGWIMVFLNKIILGVDREWRVDLFGWRVNSFGAKERFFAHFFVFFGSALVLQRKPGVFLYRVHSYFLYGCTIPFSDQFSVQAEVGFGALRLHLHYSGKSCTCYENENSNI